MSKGSLALIWISCLGAEEFSPEQLDFFEKRIRPVLSEKCYGCHSAGAEKLKAALLLDHREHLLAGGDTGPAISPGQPDESLLIRAIGYESEDLKMPPKGPLSPEVTEDFRKWIADGAAWPNEPVPPKGGVKPEKFDLQERFETHWSWRPVKKPPLPQTKKEGVAPRSEIDSFIRAQLEAAGLRSAEAAEPRTFIRRVFFDLIGLPPSPEQMGEFLADASPGSYEKLVDSLLASPHFGEKWARHWMDLVRYAETYGHEFDYPIDHAFEYRDYLIRAYNADLPYDQFLHEHLAGDLMDNPRRHPEDDTNESLLGTAFWYFHEATHAPTDVRQDEADRMDNQLDVFGKTFLGLTVACARCHDHKFDAISTADYYALTAYLESSCRQEIPLDPGRERERCAAQLEKWRGKGQSALANIPDRKIREGRPGPYLAAAVELTQAAVQSQQNEVFEDFESGTYEKWTVAGDAFGKAPARGAFGPQNLSGQKGKGLANSFHGDDRLKGTLTSAEFVIKKPWLNFLIAGGQGDDLSVELLIEGHAVQVARGRNSDQLELVSWDLSPHLGKKARLKIADQASGGWGHIVVDHIVFSNVPALHPSPTDQELSAAAASRRLDPETLQAWVKVLGGETHAAPGNFLARIMSNPKQAVESLHSKIAQDQTRRAEFEKQSVLLASFHLPQGETGWSVSGKGFRPPTPHATLSFETDRPFAAPGVFSSARNGAAQNGILRSPTFEIKNRQIHVRARSKKLFARVVVDHYHMAQFSGLLFGGTIHKDIDTGGEFRWFSFGGNLDKYIGHHAYLEFVDQAGAVAEIAEIWMSDAGAPPVENHPLEKALAGTGASTLADIAANLDAAWDRAWQSVRQGKADVNEASLLNWMADQGLWRLEEMAPTVAQLIAAGHAAVNNLPAERHALAMAEGTPVESFVHIRGSYRSPGETVTRRNLTALGGNEGNRLDLARQLTSPENPLVARVMVNRLWHQLFGRGLVPTVDDFGPMGQPCSHPELLDWLAATFIEDGWSVKKMIRRIVLSDTYRQSSLSHPSLDAELLERADPQNILLHRMPVKRLPAEAIRDAMLAVSGRLDPALFGPPVPTFRTDFMTGRGGRPSGPLDGAGRRSIYGAVYRNFLSPFMLTFDQPSPFGPKGRRSVSNVPAQSLALLNDPFVLEQARFWASRAVPLPPDRRIAKMHEQAFGVIPDEKRLAALREFLGNSDEEQAWAELAHLLFNMKDFIYLK